MRRKNYLPKKKTISIEGETVVGGVGAFQGQVDDDKEDNNGEARSATLKQMTLEGGLLEVKEENTNQACLLKSCNQTNDTTLKCIRCRSISL